MASRSCRHAQTNIAPREQRTSAPRKVQGLIEQRDCGADPRRLRRSIGEEDAEGRSRHLQRLPWHSGARLCWCMSVLEHHAGRPLRPTWVGRSRFSPENPNRECKRSSRGCLPMPQKPSRSEASGRSMPAAVEGNQSVSPAFARRASNSSIIRRSPGVSLSAPVVPAAR